MNEADPHIVGDVDKIPDEWENNSTLTYAQYYTFLGLETPTANQMGEMVASVLEDIVEANKDRESASTSFTVAQSPPITVPEYLKRISTYSQCSPESLVLALIYIDKYHRDRESTCLDELNVHK
jgi:hypothetical protein